MRKLFPIKDGEVFDISLMRKGWRISARRSAKLGYQLQRGPHTTIDEAKKLINITVDIDEGAQFYVRRIEFTGNTTTRDKVIRRELVLEEGNVYNSRLWELSLLRLNQLGYFETLKNEQDSTLKTNNQDDSADITLKVKEKRQEQYRIQWRRQRTGWFVYRTELSDEQLPWSGRCVGSEPFLWTVPAQSVVQLHAAISVRSAASSGIHGLQYQVQLQPGATAVLYRRTSSSICRPD